MTSGWGPAPRSPEDGVEEVAIRTCRFSSSDKPGELVHELHLPGALEPRLATAVRHRERRRRGWDI